MRKGIKHYRDLTKEERLEHNRKVMKLYRNGMWEQIHGTVHPMDDYKPTEEELADLKARIQRLNSLSRTQDTGTNQTSNEKTKH